MNAKNQKSRENKDRANDMPEDKTPEQITPVHSYENEQEQQQGETEGSYSEHLDVTPPKPHEFPNFGIVETDFVSRDHGRTTGRMIDHEPGL